MYIPEFLERENMRIYTFGLMHSIGKSFDCGREEFQILGEIFIPDRDPQYLFGKILNRLLT